MIKSGKSTEGIIKRSLEAPYNNMHMATVELVSFDIITGTNRIRFFTGSRYTRKQHTTSIDIILTDKGCQNDIAVSPECFIDMMSLRHSGNSVGARKKSIPLIR